MSETAKVLFDTLSAAKETLHAIAPGLKNMGPEIGAELSRLGSHGATEMGAAIFHGNGFVLYGSGADRHKWNADQQLDQKELEHEQKNEPEQGSEQTETHGRGR